MQVTDLLPSQHIYISIRLVSAANVFVDSGEKGKARLSKSYVHQEGLKTHLLTLLAIHKQRSALAGLHTLLITSRL